MRTYLLGVCLVAIVLITSEVYGATWLGNFRSYGHPGKCVISKDLMLNESQTITKSCVSITCGRKGETWFANCGDSVTKEGCVLVASKYPEADYPKCCKVLRCSEEAIED